jgi:hypothetical protein
VPLAGIPSEIARVPEGLRPEREFRIQLRAAILHAGAKRGAAGEHLRAADVADRIRRHRACEGDALAHERVEMRRLHHRMTERADGIGPHVIGEEKDEVRRSVGGFGRRGSQ